MVRVSNVFLLLLSIFFQACIAVETYRTSSRRWLGAPVDDLVLSWGPPQSSFDLATGAKVLQFVREQEETDMTYDFDLKSYVTVPRRRVCRVNFYVSPDRIIRDVAFDGDCDQAVRF